MHDAPFRYYIVYELAPVEGTSDLKHVHEALRKYDAVVIDTLDGHLVRNVATVAGRINPTKEKITAYVN